VDRQRVVLRERIDARLTFCANTVGPSTRSRARAPPKLRNSTEALSLLNRSTESLHAGREEFSTGAGARQMNSHEFAYYGARLKRLNETIASWCARRDCVLETTALLQGARLRISGPDKTVREAIRTVRLWIRNTN